MDRKHQRITATVKFIDADIAQLENNTLGLFSWPRKELPKEAKVGETLQIPVKDPGKLLETLLK